jgi:hypothetical protein
MAGHSCSAVGGAGFGGFAFFCGIAGDAIAPASPMARIIIQAVFRLMAASLSATLAEVPLAHLSSTPTFGLVSRTRDFMSTRSHPTRFQGRRN